MIKIKKPKKNLHSQLSMIFLISKVQLFKFFIGFLEMLESVKDKTGKVETSLIYGCRDDDSFLYKSKLEKLTENGILENLFVAFSRKEPKKYVQDIIQDESERIKNLIERQGLIYICGDAAGLGIAIKKNFTQIFGKRNLYKSYFTEGN